MARHPSVQMDSSYLGICLLNQYRLKEMSDSMNLKVSVQTTFYILDRNPAGRVCVNYLVPPSMEKMTIFYLGVWFYF